MKRQRTSPRERILKTALSVFARKGLGGLSMRSLARKVGVTTMATYRHFRNKEELVAALVEAGFQIWAEYLSSTRKEPAPLKRIERVLDCYFAFAMEHSKFFELMFLAPRPGVPRSPEALTRSPAVPAQAILGDVRACISAGVFRKDDPARVLLHLWAQAHGLIALHWTGRFGSDRGQFRRLYRRSLRMALRGLCATGDV